MKPTPASTTLFYHQPGRRWLDALPLGNGRIAMMVYGGIERERLQLDEATFWSGEAPLGSVRGGPADVAAIRSRLLAGDYATAEQLCRRITGNKGNYGTHLPLGALQLDFDTGGEVQGYRRWLDLETGVAGVEYSSAGQRYRREIFVSNPHQVAVIRITAEPGAASRLRVLFNDADGADAGRVDQRGDLLIEAQARETIHSDGNAGVTLAGRVRVLAHGASVTAAGNAIAVEPAEQVVILVALGTTWGGNDPSAACASAIDRAAQLPYEVLKAAHIEDVAGLMGRLQLSLGDGSNDALPTDTRLERVRSGAIDPGLDALLCQYGRYLLLASSRPDSPLPNHLQGIWNDNLACRMEWTCDMHLDINTQMNYWPSEAGNLAECNAPLWSWITDILMPSGQRTARQLYGCRGWTAHTVANAWGYSAPGWHEAWGIWPSGSAWIATHLWQHYLYNGDREFLERTAYDVLRGCAEFMLDYLVEDPDSGFLLSGPSLSPENGFIVDGVRAHNSLAPTCDTLLCREIFGNCIDAARILGRDEQFSERLAQARDRLPPFRVGGAGQLQEWLDDHQPADPHHRHISHLLALYPFSQITRERTPELAVAAERALDQRLQPAGSYEIANWALAMLITYYARLGDGRQAHHWLQTALAQLTYANLMVCHPVYAGAEVGIYELDGNTGIAAGILEMLLQSHDGIRLLPALPPAWQAGSVLGVRARGGFELDISWRDGTLSEARVISRLGNPCTISYGNRVQSLNLAAGESATLKGADFAENTTR